jgi:hypothetical protein
MNRWRQRKLVERGHGNAAGGIAHGARIEQALQVRQPFVPMPQSRQRRAGQRVVAAPACHAAVTLQAVGLAAAVPSAAAAMRAGALAGGLFDEGKAAALS